MERDNSIFVIDEGSRVKYSFNQPTVLNHFPDLVLTAPVREGGIVAVALGAAPGGIGPIVDFNPARYFYARHQP